MRVTYNAGSKANSHLWFFFGNQLKTDQELDVIAEYENGYKIGTEFKGTDLHKSCMGKGTEAHLETELKKYFKQCNETWIWIVGDQLKKDIQYVLKLALKYRHYHVSVKWYDQYAQAVRRLKYYLEHKERIDLSLPEYVNESDAATKEARMLRQFFSDKEIEKIISYQNEKNLSPRNLFNKIEDILEKNTNYYRIWLDWWWTGTQPKRNTLSVKKEAQP